MMAVRMTFNNSSHSTALNGEGGADLVDGLRPHGPGIAPDTSTSFGRDAVVPREAEAVAALVNKYAELTGHPNRPLAALN